MMEPAISSDYLVEEIAEVLGLDSARLIALSIEMRAGEPVSIRIETVITADKGIGILKILKRYTIAKQVFPVEEEE